MQEKAVEIITIYQQKKFSNRHIFTGGEGSSHKTIGEFIKYRLGGNIRILFRRVVEILREKENIDMSISFLNGTNLQTNVNKYTFVWRRAVKKYLKRLLVKITNAINNLNDYILLKYQVEFEINEEYEPKGIIYIVDWLLMLLKRKTLCSMSNKAEARI